MTLAVLGSVALNFHQQTRTPADLDILGTYDDIQAYVRQLGKRERILANYPSDGGKKIIVKTDKRIVEAEVAWEGSDSEALFKLIVDEKSHIWLINCFLWDEMVVPELDVLYMLKMSHRYRKDSPHFLKTMRDIQLMRSMGAKIRPEHEEWLKWRKRETYNYSLPKLNQSKKDFFDNSNSIYTWDHDDLHRIVKHLDVPAYELYKPDVNEVYTSKEMFFSVSQEVRLYGAIEEIRVLSLERSIYPFPHVDWRWAFNKAHEKLATSVSSGWFRSFVYDEYDTIQSMYSDDYVYKFYDELKTGNIKKFSE